MPKTFAIYAEKCDAGSKNGRGFCAGEAVPVIVYKSAERQVVAWGAANAQPIHLFSSRGRVRSVYIIIGWDDNDVVVISYMQA